MDRGVVIEFAIAMILCAALWLVLYSD